MFLFWFECASRPHRGPPAGQLYFFKGGHFESAECQGLELLSWHLVVFGKLVCCLKPIYIHMIHMIHMCIYSIISHIDVWTRDMIAGFNSSVTWFSMQTGEALWIAPLKMEGVAQWVEINSWWSLPQVARNSRPAGPAIRLQLRVWALSMCASVCKQMEHAWRYSEAVFFQLLLEAEHPADLCKLASIFNLEHSTVKIALTKLPHCMANWGEGKWKNIINTFLYCRSCRFAW